MPFVEAVKAIGTKFRSRKGHALGAVSKAFIHLRNGRVTHVLSDARSGYGFSRCEAVRIAIELPGSPAVRSSIKQLLGVTQRNHGLRAHLHTNPTARRSAVRQWILLFSRDAIELPPGTLSAVRKAVREFSNGVR